MPGTLERLEDGFAAAPNLGIADCLLRIGGGVALTALAVSEAIGGWGYVGIALAATGASWFCPVYQLLGLSTREQPGD